MTKQSKQENIILPEAPAIPSLTFRGFRGEVDFPLMLAVINGSKDEDGIQRSETPEEVKNNYQHLVNCDPYRDMLFAEVNGQVIAYNRVFWEQLEDKTRLYNLFGFLLPQWRRKGIGTVMLRHAERRLREIATGHPQDGERFFQSFGADTEKGALALLECQGFKPIRYELDMRRDLSEPFPDTPMPEGLEVRPVDEAHVWPIFDAMNEAFRDHWSYRQESREEFEGWMNSPTYNPKLWKVAWDGDQVAGMVLNFLNPVENEEYKRKRGYTEGICVRRTWRKRGLARSLIVQSMKMFKEMGMTETAHGVDAQNLSGALRLYQSVGYRQVKLRTIFRKPMDKEFVPS
ncbi:MAG: GNAT family N-acetyltransferase [Anaerolineales bacterium]|nr:GNAT family N-acetyltransferase [Anaerolineales bacterium]